MKIVISEQADADLLQIFQYLAERNPNAAGAIARDIDRSSRTCVTFRSLAGRGLVSLTAFEASSPASM
jgi:plasmid stabilization system protein ParE